MQEITLAHQTQVEQLRLQYGYHTAAHSFAQMYLWRNILKLHIHLQPQLYAAHNSLYGRNAWLFPVGDRLTKQQFLEELMHLPDLLLTNLRHEDVIFLQECFPEKFVFESAPEESEYLYDRAEQLTLHGKRFAGIRNHIRRAERDHVLSVALLSEQNLHNAISIAEDWTRLDRSAGDHGIRDDGVPTEMLQLHQELQVHGVVVYVNHEPFAVCAGYPLSETVFDFSLAKLRENLPGLSYWAKRALYESLPDQFTTINAEDDVGIQGLRTMKHQMQPSGMIEMFHATAVE